MIDRQTHASWRARKKHHSTAKRRSSLRFLALLAGLITLLSACSSDADTGSEEPQESSTEQTDSESEAESESESGTDTPLAEFSGTLAIGAIPDQDPEVLQRLYGLLVDHLETELPGVTVEYVPVTDYQGAVSGFVVGDLDVVWYGGLTGVQARLEVEGSEALLQRDIDEAFTSVFIASVDTGIEPFDDVAGLSALEGHSFTFGSESSTSGRLMPQSFLSDAGLDIDSSFTGEAGFSGSHDATIELVEAGTFETGALNSQVWDSRVEEGLVDTSKVTEVFRTPPYYDYHWVAQPSLDDEFGEGFTDAFAAALTSLDVSNPDHAAILELFGAGAFIPTENSNYAAIEAVARDIGAIR